MAGQCRIQLSLNTAGHRSHAATPARKIALCPADARDIAFPGEGSLAESSVGVWRRSARGRARSGDTTEDAVGLIGKTGSVEQRGYRLIRVTVSKYERPEAWDRQRPTIVDREGAH